MLIISKDQYSFGKEVAEMRKSNDEDLKLYLDDIVEEILLINKENSNEGHILNLSNEDEVVNIDEEWNIDEFIRSFFHQIDCDVENDKKLNNKNECNSFTEMPSQKEIVQNTSQCPVQKTTIDIFKRFNNNTMNPRVILKKLSNSSIQKLQRKMSDTKASSIKIEKSLYRCTDCHFKTEKRRKMVFHLDETSHEFVSYKNRVISNGNFYSAKRSRIYNEYKPQSKLHYQLRKKCSYNTCHFTAKNWKIMYNHVKFTHLQVYRLKRNKNRLRNKYTPKHVYRNIKLKMKAQVILERLPAHIVNSQEPVPIKLWSSYSRNILLKSISANSKRKVISTIEKYPCAFDKCMFVSKNWQAMHRHVKLCHVKSVKSCM